MHDRLGIEIWVMLMKENKSIDRGIWKNLKSTYKYAKKGRKYLCWFMITNILLSIISIIVPIFTAKRLLALTNGMFQNLLGLIVLIFVLEITRNIVGYLSGLTYDKFYYDARKNMQIELTRETLRITQEELNNNSSGVFIERINGEANSLTDIFTSLIDYLIRMIGNIGVLVSIFAINFYLGIIYSFFIVFTVLYSKYFSNISSKKREKYFKSREKTGGFISEIVRGAKDIKILNAEEPFLNKATDFMKETNDVSYRYKRTMSKISVIEGSLRDLCDLMISVFIYFLLIRGYLSIEFALVIYNYHSKILATAYLIAGGYDNLKQFNLAANRIFGILEGNEFSKEEFGTEKLEKFEGNIEFKNVSFGYEKDLDVLKNMNFKIKANEIVGFVGASGAGKTTIFNLISALNRPNAGQILFDGVDTKLLDKTSIRGNLSVISQNAYIFNMSIKDNLKVVKNMATDEEIKEACQLACLDEFINTLPNKYDTIVGEGGVTLSGGQKQRLAIARALLLKTEVLLFDEATSALDNETQEKILEAITNLKGEYTILIVAHRLSTVIDCNKIFVINNGCVEACGTHEELLKKSLTYKKLYNKENT